MDFRRNSIDEGWIFRVNGYREADMAGKLVIGLDFGTASVRAIVVDATDGRELGHGVFEYPSASNGFMEVPGEPLAVREEPADYLKGLEVSVLEALRDAEIHEGVSRKDVVGIGLDATGTSIMPVYRDGTPLAFSEPFRGNPDAMVWMWKDHSAIKEAERITELAGKTHPEYLVPIGGRHSAEMFWAKAFHCAEADTNVFDAAWSWVEMDDWLPFVLTGGVDCNLMYRNVCGAAAKAMYHPSWGYPSMEFIQTLSPRLVKLRESIREERVRNVAQPAGMLCRAWAEKLGLSSSVSVAMALFDAHSGGIGACIRPGVLVETIGTSACDLAVVPLGHGEPVIPGMFDIAKDSIIPGYYGVEGGQSSAGDLFGWYAQDIAPCGMGFKELAEKASHLKPGESGLVALDWFNGNRSVLLDQQLSGLLLGLTLKTKPEEIYRALVEAAAFGSRIILEQIEKGGITIDSIIACGGIPAKDAFLMQVYADVAGKPIHLAGSRETCALGAAVAASVCAGVYPDFPTAIDRMTKVSGICYTPKPQNSEVYERLYRVYLTLYDAFGRPGCDENMYGVMKTLLREKRA